MSAQRLEQNGLNVSSRGLPQIGQGRAGAALRSISFMPPKLASFASE
jgi:hypothetical protein